MKKLCLPALLTAIILAVIFSNVKSKERSGNDFDKGVDLFVKPKGSLEKLEATERLSRYEYKMMYDPATGNIPVSRLRDAEQFLISNTSRGNQTEALTWTERGPNNIGGRTRALLVDAADATGNTVYAGGVGGGLWKTTNFKAVSPTWIVVNDFFSNLAITCIKQNPLNTAEIYFGTGEGWFNIDAIQGAGIWRTGNGGSSWTQLGSTTGFTHVQDLEFDNNGYIYASTRAPASGSRGILRSTDNGSSWVQVLTDPTAGTTRGADLERASDGDMYATLGIFTTGHIFRSPSNGVNTGISGSWTEITPGGITTNGYQRVEIAVCPNNADRIYAVAQDDATAGIGAMYRTDNDGGAWTTLSNASWCDQGAATNTDYSRGQAWYDLVMAVDPANSNTVFSAGVVMVKTINSGTSWTQATRWTSSATCTTAPVIHADIHDVIFLNSSEVVVCTDGGIYYSTNGGTTFTSKNDGYNVTQYYGMAMHPTAGSNTMLGGSQDNGSHLFGSLGVNSVSSVSGGDGGLCFIDATNGSVWITANPGGYYNLYRSNGTYIGTAGSGNGRFIGAADYANTLNVLYYGDGDGLYGRLLSAESGSATYGTVNVSGAMGVNRQVSCVKVDPADESVIWLGCSDSENNTGAAVTPSLVRVIRANNSTMGPPANQPSATAFAGPALPAGAYISNIDIETGNSNHMILTVSNYGVTSIWESIDGGTNWTSIEGNLPDMPVRWALFIPNNYSARQQAIGGVMVATELGVWSTSSLNGGSTTWLPNNSGLANVRIDNLVLRSSDHFVGAATHGRGVYTSQLMSSLPVTLTEFRGRQKEKDILLEWSTASEINSSHFDLEKSTDGIKYGRIATVNAAGQSSDILHYQYTDKEVKSEYNYYRLRSVDLDNDQQISDVVIIRMKGIGQRLYVIGNPFSDNISLRLFKEPVANPHLKLYDMGGRLLAEKQFAKGQQLIYWPVQVPKGIYLLQANIDGIIYNRKISSQ